MCVSRLTDEDDTYRALLPGGFSACTLAVVLQRLFCREEVPFSLCSQHNDCWLGEFVVFALRRVI